MGRDTNAGRAGRGGNSGRGGHGREGRGRGASATVPRKASEVGACKDLEGHIFMSYQVMGTWIYIVGFHRRVKVPSVRSILYSTT